MSHIAPVMADGRQIVRLSSNDDFAQWRDSARSMMRMNVPPDMVEWHVAGAQQDDLFGIPPAVDVGAPVGDGGRASRARSTIDLRIDRKLLALMKTALLHSHPGRFALCYRIIWRLRDEPMLAKMTADADIIALNEHAKSVRRDIHKMHAFVRFRKIGARQSGENRPREIFVAWFEPDHHITRTVAPFFRDRFTGMDWTIVTPEARISWDGATLRDGPGGRKSDVPDHDAVEDEWRRYYASIFNPARVKPQAMKSEMPVKYWKNLPEAELISPLMREASERVRQMIADGAKMDDTVHLGSVRPLPDEMPQSFVSLDALNRFAVASDRAPSDKFSDTIVTGEGPADAPLMLIGEQPGDQEDIEGRPFVGPAGQLLDRALDEAGIDRKQIYLTNAVKRFKYESRGKRRIHSSPTQGEISHYRWWLMEEIDLVKPRLVMPLGASAIIALLGKREKLASLAGQMMELDNGPKMMAAYHPSYILRLPDEEGRRIEYEKLVRHLSRARDAIAA